MAHQHPPRVTRFFCLLLLFLTAAAQPAVAFEPARQFPDTNDRIRVFVDQLPAQLSQAQVQFAATHYVGTQKQTAELIDRLRRFNPKFIMLQYRMGVRQPEPRIVFIHGNRWTNDWNAVGSHNDWFIYMTTGRAPERVYMLCGDVREYMMDISGKYNGNTTDGWKEYWVQSVEADLKASHADGVFADSTHPPYAIPPKFNPSPLGAPPYRDYIAHLEVFYDYVYQELDRRNLYFIPNIGTQITGWDTTQGYFEDVHGAMVEGAAFHGNTGDWKLQQNNVLRLLRNGKIYIAQSGVGKGDVAERLWCLGNFLLLKHDRSYINALPEKHGVAGNLHWWPEYDLKLGAPVNEGVPKSIDELKSPSGVYYRRFQQGLVIVNPTKAKLAVDLGDKQKYQQLVPWGGGLVDTRGRPPKGGLKTVALDRTVVVEPWSAVILTTTAKPQ